MSDPEIRYLGDLQRMSLKPGDKLVLSIDGHLTLEGRERLAEMMKRFCGDTPVLILERGMKIAAVGENAMVEAA